MFHLLTKSDAASCFTFLAWGLSVFVLGQPGSLSAAPISDASDVAKLLNEQVPHEALYEMKLVRTSSSSSMA